jgi:nucleoside-diphosphate-sugar epimerase
MKVFVAGATGALGLPLVRELVSRGHEVTGLTRSPEKRAALERLGAAAVVADALDAEALTRAVRAAAPTHVVDLLTAYPDGGPMRPKDMVATDTLRTRGTAHLLQAAIAAGAQRIVGESYFAVYGYGDHGDQPLAEDAPPARPAGGGMQASVDAIRALESQLLEANARGDIEGLALRLGSIYGPESPGTQAIFDLLRRRRLPLVGGARGITPFLHTADAARAFIAALERGRPGAVYNIADETATSFNTFLLTAAEAIGAPRPATYPGWLVRLLAPAPAATATSRIPLDTSRAHRDLGWTPQFPRYAEGLRQAAQPVAPPEARERRVQRQPS